MNVGGSYVDFCERLKNAKTYDAAWDELLIEFRNLGGSHLITSEYSEGSCSNIRWSIQDEGATHAFKKLHADAADPRKKNALYAPAPFFAGYAFRSLYPHLTPFAKQAEWEGARQGLRAAMVIPFHRPGVGLEAEVGYCADDDDKWFMQFVKDYGPRLLTTVSMARFRFQEIEHTAQLQHLRLLNRHREALTWLASGLRRDEIAAKMGVSTRTIEAYLAEARSALDSSTSAQAVARAVHFGLINL